MAVQGGVVANPGTAIGIASAKTSLTFVQAFTRGVLCNWLVCMAGTITGGVRSQGGVIVNLQLVLVVLCSMTPRNGEVRAMREAPPANLYVAHIQPTTSMVKDNANREWIRFLLIHALFGVLTHKLAAP